MPDKLLLVDGVSKLNLANGIDFLLLEPAVTTLYELNNIW